MLAAGPGAEVRPRDEDRAVRIAGVVEDERGVVAPGTEQAVLEPGAGDPLEVDRRDDLVGVDVGAPQRNPDAGMRRELLHVRPPPGRPATRGCYGPPWPRRPADSRGACARPCPAGPRSCGWTSTRC